MFLGGLFSGWFFDADVFRGFLSNTPLHAKFAGENGQGNMKIFFGGMGVMVTVRTVSIAFSYV